MSAFFRIGQSGVFEAYGRARDDLQPFSVGGVVTLEAQDLTHATYTWSVFGKPIDGVAPVLTPVGAVCTAQLEERGGYLIQLVVDAGLATEDVDILYIGLPLANSGLPLPAEYETNQDNVPLPHDGSQGWWYKIERWIKWAEERQSPFVYGAGGPRAVKLDDVSCNADGNFSLAFGYVTQTLQEYSEAFGCNVQANWVGEAVRSGGGFAEGGSAQSSRINLYCHTDMVTPSTDLTPTGTGGSPLTVLSNKVYACEVLLVAALTEHWFGATPCAAWKLEFLVHGGSSGSDAMLVGSLNKLLFSRDSDSILDTWDVNVTVGGSGPLATDIKITVTQGAASGTVRWDAELNMAQVIVTDYLAPVII